jgi:two-component system, sensor histidine kinase and response regulator
MRNHWFLQGVTSALLCGLTALSSLAFAALPDRSVNADGIGAEPTSLTEYFEVLEDPSKRLTFADVRSPEVAAGFKPSGTTIDSLNLSFTKSAYWLRLKVRNGGDQQLDQLLEIANARLADVRLYGASPTQTERVVFGGFVVPFAQRPYPHRFIVFPLSLPPKTTQTLYLRVETLTPMDIPARLWDRAAFLPYERNEYMVQAVYFGTVLAMILFNLLLFSSLRDSGYLLYMLWIAMVTLGVASYTGFAMEFLWDDSPYWTMVSLAIFGVLSFAVLMLFLREMVSVRTIAPRLDAAIRALIVFNVVLATLCLLFGNQSLIKISATVTAVEAVLILCISLYCAFRGLRGARLFAGIFLVFLLATVTANLRRYGIVPSNIFTINGMQIGSAIEMLLLAYVLADRFNVIRSDREAAQAEALEAQRRLLDSLRDSERVLEARVQERTSELSATVTRLQHTQHELVEAEKRASLGSLVAGVSHELNTPIGIALTTASTLEDSAREFKRALDEGGIKRSTLESFVQRSIDMGELLVRSCHRAANLVSSFKQVAVDQTSEHRRGFNLLELVNDNVTSLWPSVRHAGWTIQVDVPSEIECDSYPGPLGQVLTNLMQNAGLHAFEDRTTGLLCISASSENDVVELRISDNGQGMSEQTLARIFEPFFTTKLGRGGSGLGLAICRNMVTGVLGGQLSATSEIGVGSQFIMRFPLIAPISNTNGHAV